MSMRYIDNSFINVQRMDIHDGRTLLNIYKKDLWYENETSC